MTDDEAKGCLAFCVAILVSLMFGIIAGFGLGHWRASEDCHRDAIARGAGVYSKDGKFHWKSDLGEAK